MRLLGKLYHILAGALLVVSTAFQLLAMFGGVVFNKQNNLLISIPWLVPVWSVMLVMLIAAFVLLFKKGDRFPWQPILLVGALVAAVVAYVVAITLRDAFPDHLNVSGEIQGLTTWRMLYRHMSSVLVGVLIAIEAAVRWVLCRRAEKMAAEDAQDLVDSTIGLDSFAGDDLSAKPKRRRRRLRRSK